MKTATLDAACLHPDRVVTRVQLVDTRELPAVPVEWAVCLVRRAPPVRQLLMVSHPEWKVIYGAGGD